MKKKPPTRKSTILSAVSVLTDFVSSKRFFYFTVALFCIFSGALAISTKMGVGPDEWFHIRFITWLSENGFSPFFKGDPDFAKYGDFSRRPGFLYHFLMSFPYWLAEKSQIMPGYMIVRLFSVLFAALNLIAMKRLFREIGLSAFMQNSILFIVANMAMYIYLGAVASYDNPANLLATVILIAGIQLSKKITTNRILVYLSLCLAATLVKVTMLPYVVFATLVFSGYIFWQLKKGYMKSFDASSLLVLKKGTALLIVATIVLFGFFSERYIGNVVRYNSIKVSCATLYPEKECLKNGLYRRSVTVQPRVWNDRFDVVDFVADWTLSNHRRTFGVVGRMVFRAPIFLEFAAFGIVSLGVLSIWRRSGAGLKSSEAKEQKSEKARLVLLSVGAFYVIIVMGTNFLAYNSTGVFGLALQGRYLFPVLGVLAGSYGYYISDLSLFKKYRSFYHSLVLSTMLLFFLGGMPWIITQMVKQNRTVQTEWFVSEEVNQKYGNLYDTLEPVNFLDRIYVQPGI